MTDRMSDNVVCCYSALINRAETQQCGCHSHIPISRSLKVCPCRGSQPADFGTAVQPTESTDSVDVWNGGPVNEHLSGGNL